LHWEALTFFSGAAILVVALQEDAKYMKEHLDET
jgi:hypothetical protein